MCDDSVPGRHTTRHNAAVCARHLLYTRAAVSHAHAHTKQTHTHRPWTVRRRRSQLHNHTQFTRRTCASDASHGHTALTGKAGTYPSRCADQRRGSARRAGPRARRACRWGSSQAVGTWRRPHCSDTAQRSRRCGRTHSAATAPAATGQRSVAGGDAYTPEAADAIEATTHGAGVDVDGNAGAGAQQQRRRRDCNHRHSNGDFNLTDSGCAACHSQRRAASL
jgi:hypothetical protein